FSFSTLRSKQLRKKNQVELCAFTPKYHNILIKDKQTSMYVHTQCIIHMYIHTYILTQGQKTTTSLLSCPGSCYIHTYLHVKVKLCTLCRTTSFFFYQIFK